MMLSFSFSLQAQNWLTSRKEAVTIATNESKQIIVYASENFESEEGKLIENELFNSETFNAIASNFVFLKLDIKKDITNRRWAIHYSGIKSVPFVTLIDTSENAVGPALSRINSENIQAYISYLKDSIK